MMLDAMRGYVNAGYLLPYNDDLRGYHIKEDSAEASLKGITVSGLGKSSVAIKYDDQEKSIVRLFSASKPGINKACDAIIIEERDGAIHVFLIELKSKKFKKDEIWEKFTVSREAARLIITIFNRFEDTPDCDIKFAYILYSKIERKPTTNPKHKTTFSHRGLDIYHEYVAYNDKRFSINRYAMEIKPPRIPSKGSR
jgi:hypothetical protein